MKIAVIQHVAFEGPGMITDWAIDRGHELLVYKSYEGELPEHGTFDLLVILGGPMSALDSFRWLEQEKLFIKAAIEKRTLTLGICLGAQLVAHVLGEKVRKNPEKEIGWFPIESPTKFLKHRMQVFQWHGETFDLPRGAIHLASTEACENQAFAYDDTILCLQFHLEMDEKCINDLVENCSNELVPGPYIQEKESILNCSEYVAVCREELFDLLDGFEMRFLNPPLDDVEVYQA